MGSERPYEHPLVRAFDLTPDERTDMVELLRAVTDHAFTTDPRLADPFAQ